MLQKPPGSELKWLRFSTPRKLWLHGFILPSRACFELVNPMSRWQTFAQMASALLLLLIASSQAQEATPALRPGTWDFDLWIAGATGEETTNSFLQSQIFMAGFAFSRAISGEISRGWLRNRMEYGFDRDPDICHLRQPKGSRPCLRSSDFPLEFQLPHRSACALHRRRRRRSSYFRQSTAGQYFYLQRHSQRWRRSLYPSAEPSHSRPRSAVVARLQRQSRPV